MYNAHSIISTYSVLSPYGSETQSLRETDFTHYVPRGSGGAGSLLRGGTASDWRTVRACGGNPTRRRKTNRRCASLIYFMQAGKGGHVKIGWTRDQKTLTNRKSTLQTGQPHPLVVLRTIDDAPRWAEVWLHGFFSGVRAAGEWFEFQAEMLTITHPNTKPQPSPSSTLTKYFGLRVPVALLDRLERAATERGVSVARIFLEPWGEVPASKGRPRTKSPSKDKT